MRAVLLVEGETERRALPSLLRRALDARGISGIGIDVVKHDGSGDVVAKLPAQMRRLARVRKDAQAVVCLLDLKGLPESLRRDSTIATCEAVRAFVSKHSDDNRLRAHFAVHEFEAWILADAAVLPRKVRDSLPKAAADRPESVNHERPPSALLKELYRKAHSAEYRKIADGVGLLLDVDPARVEAACPAFKALVDDLARSFAPRPAAVPPDSISPPM